VKAYGGAAAIAAASRFVQQGTTTSVMHPGAPGRIARAYQRPGKLRVEIVWPDGGEIRIVDGQAGWRDGAVVEGAPLAAMVLQAARLDIPALLSAPGAKVEDHGTWQHEGRTLRVLAVDAAPGMQIEAGIDPDSGRILRSRSAWKVGAGPAPAVEFVTTYSDFREVGGALFAHHEGNWANGTTTGETVIARVDLPPAIPEQVFRP
jgi:hypothetical protein